MKSSAMVSLMQGEHKVARYEFRIGFFLHNIFVKDTVVVKYLPSDSWKYRVEQFIIC